MKLLKSFCVFLLTLILVSCGVKDNANATINVKFASEINDSAHILAPKTYSYLKNLNPPLGVKPVVVAVEDIPMDEIGTFADDVFDEYCEKPYSGNTFAHRGVLVVVSKNPELVQVRVGKTYDVYCRMRGSAGGADYLQMQREVAERGVDEMCPVALNNVIRDIEECRNLPWHKRLALKLSFVYAAEKFMDDLATPSQSFFNQFYFRPFLYLVGWVKSIMGSWVMAFLLIAVVYIIVKGWIEGKLEKMVYEKAQKDSDFDKCTDEASKSVVAQDYFYTLSLYMIVMRIGIFVVKAIITFPTLAAISVLSTSRIEDIMALEHAHIPSVNLAETLMGWTNSLPAWWLVLILLAVYYMKFLLSDKGLFSLAGLPDEVQRKLYCDPKAKLFVDNVMEKGYNREQISKLVNLFVGSLMVSWVHNSHEINNEGVADQNTTDNDGKPRKRPIDYLFYDTNDECYKRVPYLTVGINLHREALWLTFFVGLVAFTILSYTYALYFLILWAVQLGYRVAMEYIYFNKNMPALKKAIDPFRLFKKVWLTDAIFLTVMIGLFFLLSPTRTPKTTEAIAEVQTALPNDMTGLYFVMRADGEAASGVTARIVQDEYGLYTMQVYSDKPTRNIPLQLDIEQGLFRSDVLGDGYIIYDKQAKSITINFSDLWILTN